MARPIPEAINRPFARPRDETRGCDWPGCGEHGDHRAPKARDRLTDYYWFCLDHVRDYNKAWNYYAGMSPEQIEEITRYDTTWQRPTWKLGQGGPYAKLKEGLDDAFVLFDEDEGNAGRRCGAKDAAHQIPREQREALRTLGLRAPVTLAEVKERYKKLVKTLHPDLNGGSKEAEEQLKVINQAYASLKNFFA